ncbi:MAG: ABC transporter permease [Candidatus Hodarchaeota archaeon]
MTQKYVRENKTKSLMKPRRKIFDLLKFYLIPGWRDPEFSDIEYEIGKTQSKRKVFRRLLTPLTVVGSIMIIFIIFCGVFAPLLTPYTVEELTNPLKSGANPFAPPSAEHPLGTTDNGYDILGRLIWGCRTAVSFGLTPIIIGSVGGVVVGTISAYFGGRTDAIIMRLADLVIVFPAVVLLILFARMVGENLLLMLSFFGLLSIPIYARLMRSSVLQVKQSLFIDAAITGGAKYFKIMVKHLIPNAISPIIINFFGGVGTAILGLTSISFLGFGDRSLPDWGADINFARVQFSNYFAAFWPGLFILIAVMGFMLVGDGLRDALDPKNRRKQL